jgi:glutamyl-tRNA reductase
MKQFNVLSLSYKQSSLEFRELFSFDDEKVNVLLHQFKELLGLEDILILSTCNRTEIYFTSKTNKVDDVFKMLALKIRLPKDSIAKHFNLHKGKAAVTHLFEVSLGLNSMILGDMQIINQVKRAYQLSADAQTAGPFLHRLMHTIFNTNKRVTHETKFKEGNTSLASAAVSRAKEFGNQFRKPKIVIVGLGEIGQTVAENLKNFDGKVVVLNRSFEKAQKLAQKYNFDCQNFEQLNSEIENASIIISAVRTPEPIINKDSISDNNRHQLYIDLSVPRSIDSNLSEHSGVIIANVDDLKEQTERTFQKRQGKIEAVNAIINSSIDELKGWQKEMEFSPVIKQFKAALEEIRQQELARHLNGMEDSQADLLNQATKNILQKIIKLPVLHLKANCLRDDADQLSKTLSELFCLEKVVNKATIK